jgi:hypothetical protein
MDYRGYGDLHDLAPHPHDDGVVLSGIGHLRALPAGIDAVVSLCRIGTADAPDCVAASDRVEVWLIDDPDPAHNPNLAFVLHDTATVIARLRSEGRTVLLHCVQAHSRTPTVAALYGARRAGIDTRTALTAVLAALPTANPPTTLRTALHSFHTPDDGDVR